MDLLHLQLRSVIRFCWQSLEGQQSFNNIKIDHELAAMGLDEFSPERQITNIVACGSSAARICQLLTGDEMHDPNAARLDSQEAASAFVSKLQATTGHLILRVLVQGNGLGHAYVFLSKFRTCATQPIDGYIYQTNVGVRAAFGLLSWVNDPKSSTCANLHNHLSSLIASYRPAREWGEERDGASFYGSQYMLTNRQLANDERHDVLRGISNVNTPPTVHVTFREVNLTYALRALRQVRPT